MKVPVLLPYLLSVLLCATLILLYLLLPPFYFMCDATYKANVYAYQELSLAVSLLAKGYRLQMHTLSIPLELQELKAILQSKKGLVVCSPVITLAVQGLGMKSLETLPGVSWVGMGKPSASQAIFSHMITGLDNQEIWQSAVEKHFSDALYIRLSSEDYQPTGFPSDRVITKGESESDEQFSKRLLKVLERQSIIHLLAPRLGGWALPLLQKPSVLWTVDASYLGLVDASHLSGAIAEDLGQTFKRMLGSKKQTTVAVRRLLTARQTYGSWL